MMMEEMDRKQNTDISRYLIPDDISVSEAVKQIDEGKKKVVFCTRDGQLSGCFTDGDMRRFILRDGDMRKPVSVAMNRNPIALSILQEGSARQFVEKNAVVAVPIINERREVVRICFRDWDEKGSIPRKLDEDIPLVIMAGGKGTRLYPFTRILPKPLIPIGDMPIMDHIINHFGEYGIKDVYMILNHKRNMIKSYYNEVNLPYHIEYVDEDQFLGTGGGLSLLKGKINTTFFLSNCDCLLDADYVCMYDYHKEHKNALTIIVSMKNVPIPYGVVNLHEDGTIETMREKPEYDFLINTGIYLVEPFVIDFLKEGEQIGMPDVAKRLIEAGYRVGGYPITEKSWLDMGQLNEMQNMMRELGVWEAGR